MLEWLLQEPEKKAVGPDVLEQQLPAVECDRRWRVTPSRRCACGPTSRHSSALGPQHPSRFREGGPLICAPDAPDVWRGSHGDDAWRWESMDMTGCFRPRPS